VFHLKRVILFLTVLVWMVGCSTHKELNQLRRQYVKNDDICDCNGLFNLREKYKTLDAFPKAVELVDSMRKGYGLKKLMVFYEDSLVRKTLRYNTPTSLAYIYIYHKPFHVLQILSYEYNFQLEYRSYEFEPVGIGQFVRYDTLGNVQKKIYKNYIKPYETEKEGRKIKRKYPICWREAYLLAKKFTGIKDDKEVYRLSRGTIKKQYWYVAFGNNPPNDIYMVNAKNGKVK
ncbi:hypothetical protein, partial [Saccharicrinis fermentans]|uniref:hypothetical protein n=1 Tax=Saccharicrinis fermentans TaxID=982 RepID=UPI00137846A6